MPSIIHVPTSDGDFPVIKDSICALYGDERDKSLPNFTSDGGVLVPQSLTSMLSLLSQTFG